MDSRTTKRFWSKVDKTDTCWVWLASTTDGYGNFWFGPKRYKAHRFSYELEYGSVPDGLLVCHQCDNPPCVRPDHLFLGTNKDNAQDRASKGRGRDSKGENSGCNLLTEQQVREILNLYGTGDISQTELYQQFGVRQTAISAIVRGINWSHINSEVLPKFTVKGERHGSAKLASEQVVEIRRLYGLGEYSCADLAQLFDVSRGYAWQIVSGKKWKHIL